MKAMPLMIPVAIGVLAASFLLAQVHPFDDGALSRQSAALPVQQADTIPPQVRAILDTKCADCHSSRVRVPFYGRFAPASWLIERDVVRARKAMDLSQWGKLSLDEQDTLKSKIAHEVDKHEMPPFQYLVVHWDARLTKADGDVIMRWAAVHPISFGPDSSVQGDADRGKAVFQMRCTGCHSLTQDREGPHLQGVYGRISGTIHGFQYSNALKNAHILWSDTTLNRWLTDPDSFVPGNNMDFHVARPDERADLIQFLKKQSGLPK
jgi:cytochrome c